MKPTKLYIFTTSESPDPYINAIAHCVANYRDLNQVVLIGIIEDRGKIKTKENDLKNLKQKITNQLDHLSEGKYLKIKGNDCEVFNIQMEAVDCERYSDLRRITYESRAWVYHDLEQNISNLLGLGNSFTCIFDVTAVLKSYLIDIYVLLNLKEITSIYSFELFNKPSHDHRDLIHNLIDGKSYSYSCLAESLYTNNRIVVSEASSIRESNLNRLQAEIKALENERSYLEDIAATNFAKLWSLIYFLILLVFVVWLYWTIKQPNAWDWVEPVLAVITITWTALSYLLQILFAGKVESLNPVGLFSVLRNWRKKGLERARSSSNQD
jgi:hypothetical protein